MGHPHQEGVDPREGSVGEDSVEHDECDLPLTQVSLRDGAARIAADRVHTALVQLRVVDDSVPQRIAAHMPAAADRHSAEDSPLVHHERGYDSEGSGIPTDQYQERRQDRASRPTAIRLGAPRGAKGLDRVG